MAFHGKHFLHGNSRAFPESKWVWKFVATTYEAELYVASQRCAAVFTSLQKHRREKKHPAVEYQKVMKP